MAATHVKSVKSSSSSSVPVSTASTSFTAGNLLVAYVGIGGGDVSTATVTDTTHTRSFSKFFCVQNGGFGIGVGLFYLANATGGATVVQLSGLTAGNAGTLVVQEWSGPLTTTPNDVSASNNGTATTSQSTGTTLTTTQASELAIAVDSISGGSLVSLPSAMTNGYTVINDSSADSELDGSQFWYVVGGRGDLVATGTQSTVFTWVSDPYVAGLGTFKLAAGGGPSILLLNQMPNTLLRM